MIQEATPNTLDTRVVLATPEATTIHLSPAGPVSRLVAWLMDLTIRGVLAVLIASPLMLLGGLGSGMMLIAFFVLEWLYPVFFEVLKQGQTPGKQAMGLRVVHRDGLLVNWSQSLLRNILRAADFLPFGFAAGLVSMLLSDRFMRLGDLVAGTMVVYVHGAPGLSQPRALRPLPLPSAWLAHLQLSGDEERALRSLATRSSMLGPERVRELLAALAPAGKDGRRE